MRLPLFFSPRQREDDYPHLAGGLCWRHPRRKFRRQRSAWARGCNTSSRTIASASSRTRRSTDGGRFSFQTPSTLKLPGEMGEEEAFFNHAGRGARGTIGPIGFSRHLAICHGRLGGQ
ncbi:hypothetical protein TcG_11525 [Trypanosoma cruzi]|nr:hypothetical protein TcG_11525 [Trypanosoma cruzi]